MTKNNPNIIMMTTLGWRIAAFRAIPSIHVEKSMTTVQVPKQKTCAAWIEPLKMECKCEFYVPAMRCVRCEVPTPTVNRVDYLSFKMYSCSTHSGRRTSAICGRRVAEDSKVDLTDPNIIRNINRRFMWFKRNSARPATGLKMWKSYSDDYARYPQRVLPLLLLRNAAELMRTKDQLIVVDRRSNTVQLINRPR